MKRKPQKPTGAEMAGMLAYIDASRKQQRETEGKGAPGVRFTVYEDKLEKWVRDLIREVKRLRKKRKTPQNEDAKWRQKQMNLDDALNRCNGQRVIETDRGAYYSQDCKIHEGCRKIARKA